jgi:hypothetical protein
MNHNCQVEIQGQTEKSPMSPLKTRQKANHGDKQEGYSDSTIAILGAATAKWLFHQEKATMHVTGGSTRIVESL